MKGKWLCGDEACVPVHRIETCPTALHFYEQVVDDICACRDLPCVEGVQARMAENLAGNAPRTVDEAAALSSEMQRLTERMNSCLRAIEEGNTPAVPARRGTAGDPKVYSEKAREFACEGFPVTGTPEYREKAWVMTWFDLRDQSERFSAFRSEGACANARAAATADHYARLSRCTEME